MARPEQTLTVTVTFRPYDPNDDSANGSFQILRVEVHHPEESGNADTLVEVGSDSSPYAMGGSRYWTLFFDEASEASITLTEDLP